LDPLDVLKSVAKHSGQKPEDATIILAVDSLHLMNAYEDARREDSNFYRTLTFIGDLMHNGFFLLVCCTTTVSGPIPQREKRLRRWRGRISRQGKKKRMVETETGRQERFRKELDPKSTELRRD
jgi:hypothetical protein